MELVDAEGQKVIPGASTETVAVGQQVRTSGEGRNACPTSAEGVWGRHLEVKGGQISAC